MFWKWKRQAQELERTLEEARREVRQMRYKVDDLEYQVTLFRQRELSEWAQRQRTDIAEKARERAQKYWDKNRFDMWHKPGITECNKSNTE